MVLGHVFDGNRTQDVLTSQSVAFDSMLLEDNTQRGLIASGFYKPSPIQLCGIPLGKCGFDLLLEAKSGTGKTAVFTVIALEKLDLNNGLQAVILAPTREIAAQICDVIKQIGSSYQGLRVEVVMGGLPLHEDVQKFKDGNVHIVVGSPGRLRHLIHDKYIDVSAVRLLVLDEADKLVEKSFMLDINYIFSTLPKEKQVIMSSATYPKSAHTFIKKYVQNAQHVCPDSNSILLGIRQKVTSAKYNSNIVKQTKYRFEELLKILSTFPFKQCLIFCNYQARVGEVHKMLTKEKWPAEQLYGQQEQLDRLGALRSLQDYKCRILVSTDLAARGIDASNVDLVINFEPPYDWQTYLHRIGRAGRFGSYGIAITILSEGEEQKKFTRILEAINAPIKITNLWTDTELTIGVQQNGDSEKESKSCIGSHSTLSPIEKPEPKMVPLEVTRDSKISDNYKALWNVLSNDFKEDNQIDIDSFQNLCNSFEKPEFESFSDLMNSLQTHEPSNNTRSGIDVYNNLNIPEIPITDYMKSLNCVSTNISSKQQKPVSNPDQQRCVNGSKINGFNGKEEVNAVNMNIKLNGTVIKKETEIENCVNNKNKSEEKSTKESHKNIELDDEYYVPNIEEDLLKAGLPTAFGSSKAKDNKDMRKCNLQNTKADSSVPNKKHSIPRNIEELLKTDQTATTSFKNVNNRKTYKQSFHHIYEDAIISKTNKIANNEISNTHDKAYRQTNRYAGKSYSARKNESSSSSSVTYESDSSSTDADTEYRKTKTSYKKHHQKQNTNKQSKLSNQDYFDWYKNLKLRVQQIELAFYIDELSKL